MESKFVENTLLSQNIVYCSVLYLAALNGHKDIVKYISELPIDTVSRGLTEFTKIFLGAQKGRLDEVKEAIAIMFGEDDDVIHVKESEELFETDVPVCGTIYEAAEFGAENLVKSFIGTGADVNAENDDGLTALQLAAKSGKAKCVEVLLKEGADIDSKVKDNHVNKLNRGKTALHMACENGRFNAVAKLLSYGVDAEVKDWEGNVALYYAVKYGSTNVVQLLINNGVNINALNNEEQQNIIVARNENVIKLLIKNGLDYKHIGKKNGNSILHSAVLLDNDILINFLLENKFKINIERKDNAGYTPLSYAAYFNNSNIITLLLKYGANINSTNISGYNVLHIGACNGHTEAVKLLLENGADINAMTTKCKSTPLILATEFNKLDTIELLLSHEADVKIKDITNKSALDYAIVHKNQEVIQMLRKHYK